MFRSDHRQAFKFALALSASLVLSTWLLPYLVQFGGCKKQSSPFGQSVVQDPLEFFPKSTSLETVQDHTPQGKTLERDSTDDKLFLLENKFFQVVVTSQGGSIKEINLPLSTSFEERQSNHYLIQPVEIDKWVVDKKQEDAVFPLLGKAVFSKEKSLASRYHPLVRRSLISRGITIPSSMHTLSLFSDYEDLSKLQYSVVSHTATELIIQHVGKSRTIRRIFRLRDVPYVISAVVELEGDCRGIWITSGIPETEILSNQPAPRVQFRHIKGNGSSIETVS
uniref:hypothetical protein n=1 Tax=Candidatus Similichlamydia epinepheli TaxID=1903953 RepID=UPI001300265A